GYRGDDGGLDGGHRRTIARRRRPGAGGTVSVSHRRPGLSYGLRTLDLDPAGLGGGGLAELDAEHPVVQGRIDPLRVDVSRHGHHVLELADLAGLPAQHADPLLLLVLAVDVQ